MKLSERPPGGGEDFYLIRLIFINSDPLWGVSRCFAGSWHHASKLLGWFRRAAGPLRTRTMIYQGAQAREMLARLKQDNARYQEMKRAQPNN